LFNQLRDWIGASFPIISTTIAFMLWLLSVNQARLEIQEGIGNLGLISILPSLYFASISLLTFSFLISLKSSKRNRVLLLVQTMMLIFFLNFTPTMIENTARFTGSYTSSQSVDYISQEGYFNPFAFQIHNWPGFSILYSVLLQVTGFPEQPVMSIYPTFFNLALLFPLYVLFRSVIDNKEYVWIALWVFYVGNWIGQDYFSPQSLGFFAFVLVLFLILKPGNLSMRSRNWCVTLILLFSLLVFSHMLSSIAVLAVMFVFFVSKHFQKFILISLFACLFLSWTILGAAAGFFEHNFSQFMSEAFNLILIFKTNVSARIAGSDARILVSQTRFIFSAMIAAFAFLAIVFEWRNRRIRNIEKRMLSVLAGVLFLMFLFAYGGEIFMRIFLFCLVPMAYFISKASRSKMFFCFLAIFLIVIAPFSHVIARYGGEVMDYVPESEIRGVEFFHSVTAQGYVIGSYRDSKYRPSYEFFALYDAVWKNDTLAMELYEPERLGWHKYVCLSYGAKQFFIFFLGKPSFVIELDRNMTESIHYNKIYSNPSLDVYSES